MLNSWSLRLYGDAASPDDTYVYTDDFASVGATASRRTLSDTGGNDTINGAALTGAAVIDLLHSTATIAGRALAIAAGTVIETVIGGDGNDSITGGAEANQLAGERGDDVLRGEGGADRLDGGAGTDTASYFNSSGGVLANLVSGTGSAGTAQGDILISIESLSGSQGNDALVGNTYANTLQGWNGNDVLTGAGGRDTLSGGAGADRFVYGSAAQSLIGAGSDLITDFSHAQTDRIDLAAIDAVSTVTGDQAFSFIGSALFGHHAGELRFGQADGVTTIAGDINGDGISDFAIRLTGVIALVAADFVL